MGMKLSLILLLLVIAKSSFATPPEGLSYWVYSYCETPDIQERDQCAPFRAELIVLYKEGKICGRILESWFPKSSSARFISSNYNEGGTLKFADSFQENEQDFGLATLTFSDTEAEWKVLESPRGGLVGGASDLQRQAPRGRNPASCDEAIKLWGSFPTE